MTNHSQSEGSLQGNNLLNGGLGARALFTPRLTLRWIGSSDAEALSGFAGDPLLRQKTETIPYPFDVPAAHQWIDEAGDLRSRGVAYRFAVEERATQKFVGVSALMMLAGARAELGYWLGPPFWGKGYGREAVAATVAFGADILKLRSVEAVVYSENTASVAVLRALGFEEHAYETINVPERGGARLIRRFVSDLRKDRRSTNVIPFSGQVA